MKLKKLISTMALTLFVCSINGAYAQTSKLQVGDKAPAFTLPAFVTGEDAGKISLKQFAGKKNVILAFYPKDETPGCTKEMCSFSSDLRSFDAADTQVLAVSLDTIESHQKFAGKYNLEQPLLSDKDGSVAIVYGAVVAGQPFANRVTFVIDKLGVIRKIVEGMPTNSQLLDIVKGLE